ncbi:uncharacterized protein LOC123299046 [Chrysoperla carnea]|uniref:uncharacterized protein LOC123299046 n=1 Tax=Chrysoperla carnea TaxID=189513 RepID=UPI001D068ABB|nr:uncharacterized protein LOC123299046 [Chrysoperla carnea]
MESQINSKQMDFDVFNLISESLLQDVAQCISQSDFISLMPIALQGKTGRGIVAYEQLLDVNKRDMLEYWQTVCSELQFKTKYNILQSLMVKYANSKEPKWRPKLSEIQGLYECRTNSLLTKKEKLEKGLRDLQDDLKKTEEECAKQIQKFDEDIRLHLTKIKNILKIKIRSLDELITQRHQQIDQLLSNGTLEELN